VSKPIFEDMFNFEGRRNRRSYCIYVIALIPVLVLAIALAEATGSRLVLALFMTPIYVSGWAVGSQRLRDINMSGWWVLASFVPYLGILFTVFVAFQPGTEGPNRFGPDPLGDGPKEAGWY